MKLNFTKKHIQKAIYVVSVLFPALATGNIFASINKEQTTDTFLASITSLSSSVYGQIKQSQTHFDYTLSTLLKHPAFYQMDIQALSTIIAEFQYYNPNISNVYIVNSNHDIIYGINDTAIKNIDNASHVESALKGTSSYIDTYVNDEYFLQISFPIFTVESGTVPSAALVLTYDFAPFNKSLETITKSGQDIDAYLFDKNGKVITSSTQTTSSKNGSTIDINRVKLTLDLDPKATFTLFDNTTSHGTYYELTGDMTLLVTIPSYSGIALEDLIGFVMGALGLGGAATTQALKKPDVTEAL